MRLFAVVLTAFALHAQPRAFTAADLLEWREIDSPRIHSEGGLVVFAEKAIDRNSDSTVSSIRSVSSDGKNLRTLTEGRSPRWSPDATRIAFIGDRTGAPQVFVRRLDGASDRQLTRLDSPALDFAWSPDGTALAFTARVMQTPAGVSWAPPALLPQLRVGRTRLFLVNASGGEPRALPLGNLEAVGEPAWMPDGRSLLLAATGPFDPDRPLSGPGIYSVRIADSALRRLSTGSASHSDPIASPDGSRIAWIAREALAQSYVTGKLWVANADGSRARVLAGALDRDPRHPQWSSDSRTVYFLADDRGATHVYAARNDGAARQVTSVPQRLHNFSLADNGRAVAVRAPEELIVFPVDSAGEPVTLAAPNESWLAGRDAGAVEELAYASENRTIQAWIAKPPGFDASKKYPLVLDIDDAPRRMCGGEFRLRAQILSAAGFLVLCANPRGTPGYGEPFGNLLRSRFPGDDFDDLMRGVDAVVAKGYTDPARLHVVGGLLAAWAIGHTDRFRSAVARRVIADWTLDVATAPDGARRAAAWLGAFPWSDASQFTGRSPIYAAQNFKTPTLVIAQEHDPAASELYFALRMRRVESYLVRIGDKPSQAVLELETTIAWLKNHR